MVYLLDTNIFLRTLVKSDEDKEDVQQQREECVRFLELVKENKIKAVTCHLVLAEVMWTLLSFYGVDRETAARSVEGIVNLRGLRVGDGYQVGKALEMFKRKKVKFIDTMLASIPEVADKEWVIVSYDREFDKLGVVRKEPREVGGGNF
jgi:predicted nucleic-acid-binding protein